MEYKETYVTGTGQILTNIHPKTLCEGRPCTIHAPSDHHMRDWPTHWRSALDPFDYRTIMERQCPHDVGHPDPDHMAYLKTILSEEAVWAEGLHGCDGCCVSTDSTGVRS
jgi:hypothetical protein